jgi:hypothetical protein
MIKYKIVYSEYSSDVYKDRIVEFRKIEFDGNAEGCIEYMEMILLELKKDSQKQK